MAFWNMLTHDVAPPGTDAPDGAPDDEPDTVSDDAAGADETGADDVEPYGAEDSGSDDEPDTVCDESAEDGARDSADCVFGADAVFWDAEAGCGSEVTLFDSIET